MSAPKYSQGPWVVNPRGSTAGRNSLLVETAEGLPVAEVRKQYLPTGKALQANDAERQLANAHLIAAAPELLEACERLERFAMSLMGRLASTPAQVSEARIIMAKAKGGES